MLRSVMTLHRHISGIVVCAASIAAQTAHCEDTQCLSTSDTRASIAEHGLAEPFAAMREAAARVQGEALNARLCRSGDIFVYEVRVLKSDGQVVKTSVRASRAAPSAIGGEKDRGGH